MTHPVLAPGRTAVVTGGAAGIGLAAARRFAGFGMKLAIADLGAERLAVAAEALIAAGAPEVRAIACDVSDRAQVEALKAEVDADLGGADRGATRTARKPGRASGADGR